MNRDMHLAERHLKGLQKEEEQVRRLVEGQFGTTIPMVFASAQDNFIIDPSNVGQGILSRMIKTDDTVSAGVQFKIMMVLSKIGEYTHENEEIMSFVQDFLSRMKRPSWEGTMESMMSYVGYKFSVSEIIWGLNKELQKVPLKCVTYHPTTVAFEVDQSGDITPDGVIQFVRRDSQLSNPNRRFTQVQTGFNVKNPFSTPVDRIMPTRVPYFTTIGLVRIPRNKVVHHAGMQFDGFGNPYGNSAVRTAHLAWQLKQFIMKQMGIATKRKATPKIWATAPKGGQVVEVTIDGEKKHLTAREALRQMLLNIENTDSFVTGPEDEGYKMEVLADQVGLDQYVNLINACNVWIMRCFLLPSLVLTDGQAGSRSLGDKHFQIVDRIAESEADRFTETLINDLIQPAIEKNFGEQDDYGSFARRPQTLEERERLARVFGDLTVSGYMSPASQVDVDHVRDVLSLPEQAPGFLQPGPDDDGIDGEPGFVPDAPEGGDEEEGDNEPQEEGSEESGDENPEDAVPEEVTIAGLLDLIDKVKEGSMTREDAIKVLVASGMTRDRAADVLPNPNGGNVLVDPKKPDVVARSQVADEERNHTHDGMGEAYIDPENPDHHWHYDKETDQPTSADPFGTTHRHTTNKGRMTSRAKDVGEERDRIKEPVDNVNEDLND